MWPEIVMPNPPETSQDPTPAGTMSARGNQPAGGKSAVTKRTVAFSRGGLRGGGGQFSISTALIPFFLLWGAIGSIGAFFALGRFAWMPPGVRAALVTGVFVLAGWLLVRMAARGYRRVMRSISLPMEMDPTADVNVVCWPDQKGDLDRLIPEDGVSGDFEPEFFRVWIASRTPMAVRMMRKRGARLEVFRVIALVLTLQGGFYLAASGHVAWEPVVAVFAITLLSPFAWAFLVPTYLRVIPGRVDIVRFRPLRSVASVERIDLRSRPVRLDMKRKELFVGWWHVSHPEPDEPGEGLDENGPDAGSKHSTDHHDRLADTPGTSQNIMMVNAGMKDPQGSLGTAAQIRAVRVVPLWGSLDMNGAAVAVFRAAVSTAEPGPVPDDRLM